MAKSAAMKARLSEETKQNIYDAVKAGASQASVAERFGVAQSTVNRVVKSFEGRIRTVVSDDEGELKYDSTTDSYVGTVYLPDGTKGGERFTNSKHLHEREIVSKYVSWRKRRLDEHEFMARVERRDQTVPKEKPKAEPVQEPAKEAPSGSVYVLMLRGEKAKAIGWYHTLEAALDSQDSMNEALTMAGFEPLYDVYECECRD